MHRCLELRKLCTRAVPVKGDVRMSRIVAEGMSSLCTDTSGLNVGRGGRPRDRLRRITRADLAGSPVKPLGCRYIVDGGVYSFFGGDVLLLSTRTRGGPESNVVGVYSMLQVGYFVRKSG